MGHRYMTTLRHNTDNKIPVQYQYARTALARARTARLAEKKSQHLINIRSAYVQHFRIESVVFHERSSRPYENAVYWQPRWHDKPA